MASLLRLAQLIVVASSLTACATLTVGSHVERGVDFSHFRTYEWAPPDALPAGDARLEGDLVFLDNMQGAIEKALAEKGYTRATFGIPDLLVHYHAAASQRIDAGLLARERAACHGGAYGARAIDNEAATLVVDMVDSRTDELVWRGWAQNDLDSLLGDHRRMVREINEAVQRMMAQLPGGL